MSHGQTELTVGAVAVGVLLVVFLSSLINGLQIGLMEDVVGSIPHVSVEAATLDAKPLWQVRGGSGEALTSIEKMTTRSKRIGQWGARSRRDHRCSRRQSRGARRGGRWTGDPRSQDHRCPDCGRDTE